LRDDSPANHHLTGRTQRTRDDVEVAQTGMGKLLAQMGGLVAHTRACWRAGDA